MQIQPVNIIQSVLIFQAVFGVLLLWSSKPYRGLVYLLLLVAVSMTFNLLEEALGTREWYLVTPIFLLAKGPYFYLFVYRLVYPDSFTMRRYLLHSLPMFLVLPLTSWPQFVIALGSITQLIYAFIVFKLILKYHKASFSQRSDAESLQLTWVLNVLAAFLILGLLDLVRLNLQPYISLGSNLTGQFLENAIALFLYSFLIFKAVKKPVLFKGLQSFEATELQAKKSQLIEPDGILIEVYASLEKLIREKSLHHKQRLSLSDLAEETGLNSREISRAINVVGETSFCDFVNRLRVSDVKHYLTEQPEKKLNLLDLAFQFGFNSKSSFNSVFKRETGMTPTQYLKNQHLKNQHLDKTIP